MSKSIVRLIAAMTLLAVAALFPVFGTGADQPGAADYDTSEFVTISNYMFGAPPENGQVLAPAGNLGIVRSRAHVRHGRTVCQVYV